MSYRQDKCLCSEALTLTTCSVSKVQTAEERRELNLIERFDEIASAQHPPTCQPGKRGACLCI